MLSALEVRARADAIAGWVERSNRFQREVLDGAQTFEQRLNEMTREVTRSQRARHQDISFSETLRRRLTGKGELVDLLI